jgi:hypothetical protein
MKAYYLAPQQDFFRNHGFYQSAIQAIQKEDVAITDTWIVDYNRSASDNGTARDSSMYYQEAMTHIMDSDIAIFDATVSSMSIGHQLTYALYLQKPTLLLVNGAYRNPKDLFIAGSESSLLQIATYERQEEVEQKVRDFIRENRQAKKMRLNLALDKAQSEYLTWASFTYGITKTSLVQQAIDKMRNSDEDFKKQNRV